MATAGALTRRGFLTGSVRSGAVVAAIGEGCLPSTGVHCQSCGDVCPEAAICFHPRLGGPPLPEVVTDTCTGCGDCLAACPVDAVMLNPREAANG